MNRIHRYVPALFSLLVALFLVVTGSGQTPLPVKDLSKLVALEAKFLQDELGKEKLTKKGQKKVKMAAFMVAVYAQTQSDKANAAGMATLRDTALKLLAAADAGKTDEAKKFAGLIKADIPADPVAKTAPVALEKLLELESVMRVFSSPQVGGFGLEKTLEDLADAKEPDAAQLEQAALVGQKAAFIAHLAQSYPPEKEEGKKTKAAWAGFATDMKAAALDLAATAAKKSPDVGKLANKLTTACTKCHDVFR